MNAIISRDAARSNGQSFFYTGKPCQNGHTDFRYVCNTVCVSCGKENRQKYRLSANPEVRKRKRERSRIYYSENKDRIKQRTRTWKENFPERASENGKKYHRTIGGRARSLLNSARIRAAKKNIDFAIPPEWVENRLARGVCEITGLPFVFSTDKKGFRNPFAPSLDRRDNSQGYTEENCRVILWALNMGFADWGEDIYSRIAESYLKSGMKYDL